MRTQPPDKNDIPGDIIIPSANSLREKIFSSINKTSLFADQYNRNGIININHPENFQRILQLTLRLS